LTPGWIGCVCAWTYANWVRGQITTTAGALADAEGIAPGAARSQRLAAAGAPPPGELTVEMVTDAGVGLAEADCIRAKDQACARGIRS